MSEVQTESTVPSEGAPASALRWYVVHAYSGMEKAVERNLRERIDRAGMQAKFGRILVPTEEVVEMKNGKKAVTERQLLPRLRAGRDGDGRRVLAPGQAHAQGHRLRRRRQEPAGADLGVGGHEDRPSDAGGRGEAAPQGRVGGRRGGARQGRPVHRLQRRRSRTSTTRSPRCASRSPSSAAPRRWNSTSTRSRRSDHGRGGPGCREAPAPPDVAAVT